MSLFRLEASIRIEGSHSRAIADIVEQEWRNAYPGEPVIRRHRFHPGRRQSGTGPFHRSRPPAAPGGRRASAPPRS